MPYSIRKRGSEFCVVKKEDGDVIGCSPTRRRAISQLRAIMVNEGKDKKEIDELVKTSIKELNEQIAEEKELEDVSTVEEATDILKNYGSYNSTTTQYYPVWETSYSQLIEDMKAREEEERVSEMIAVFPQLAQNIMISPDITDKPAAITALASELSTLIESKQELDEPEEDDMSKSVKEDSLFDRLVLKIKEFLGIGGHDISDIKDVSSMTVWKNKDGNWLWCARYSNTFRDRDRPPEIISSSSHRRFVELVDKGLTPLPELWIWHAKELKIGIADVVGYDEVNEKTGFAVAFGHFYPGFEKVAEWLSKKDDVRVSHGMPDSSIKRDANDKSIIIEHITREISPLPDWAAANEITGFFSFKEANMAFPDEKRKALLEWGMPEELLGEIEKANKLDAKKAIEEGLETKESEAPTGETQEVKEEAAVVETPVAEETPPEPAPVPAEEIKNELVEALQHIMSRIDDLESKVDGNAKEITAMKTAQEEKQRSGVTNASILSMLMGERAVGTKETEVEADSDLSGAHPKEAPTTTGGTGIPFLDLMLSKKSN